jgi:hypothetical protein
MISEDKRYKCIAIVMVSTGNILNEPTLCIFIFQQKYMDKVYQLLAHGRWFSPGTPASSTIKTSRHDIAKILLKVALKQLV